MARDLTDIGSVNFDSTDNRPMQALMARIQAEDAGKSPHKLPAKHGLYEITPEMARDWLLRDNKNRPLNPRLIKTLGRDIVDGRWKVNGQTISFRSNGDLNDGQHRLWACALSGRPIQSWVIFNVEPEAFATVDTGRSRRASDVLALSGHHYVNPLASAVRIALANERGTLSFSSKSGRAGLISNEEILTFLEANPDLEAAVGISYKGPLRSGLTHLKIVPPSIIGYGYWRMRKMDPKKAERFVEILSTGENAAAGNPAHTLREYLLNDRLNKLRTPSHVVIGLMIKAWNAYYHGRRLRRVRWSRTENFPRWGDEPNVREELPAHEPEAVHA